ncbi:hypothetical protein LXL04_008160 [Taraxacum kok-saghyz]
MKIQADKHRREVEYNVGDLVYIKLKPYRQHSVAKHKYKKLAPRFYGPYKITNCLYARAPSHSSNPSQIPCVTTPFSDRSQTHRHRPSPSVECRFGTGGPAGGGEGGASQTEGITGNSGSFVTMGSSLQTLKNKQSSCSRLQTFGPPLLLQRVADVVRRLQMWHPAPPLLSQHSPLDDTISDQSSTMEYCLIKNFAKENPVGKNSSEGKKSAVYS